MEQKTQCPLCQGLHDNCFVEKTEVDGNLFESYMCFQCGMTTNSHFALDSEHLEKATENNTQLMNDLKIIDNDRGLVWFPSVVNMGEKGIIYPDGELTDWYWYYAKVVDIPEDEQKKYPNGQGGFHTHKYDIDDQVIYDHFYQCLEELNERAKAKRKPVVEQALKMPKLKKIKPRAKTS